MCTTYSYMSIGINRVLTKNIGNEEGVDLFARASFSHPHLRVVEFTEA